MQTVGPYALHRKLSSCDVGEVWSARDAGDQPFTVAVLTPAAAAGGWRDSFAAVANTLARSDGLPITAADHTGPAPWVACAAEQGAGAAHVFLALGQRLIPAPDPVEGPEASAPDPERTAPADPAPRTPAVDAEADGAARATDPATVRVPDPARPTPSVSPYPPYPPAPRPPATGHRRRSALRLAVVALLALALGGAGGLLIAGRGGPGAAGPTATAAPTPSPSLDLGLPTAPPRQPGAEPPIGGGWPADTPTFAATDRTRQLSDLDGLGFSFRVPADWNCTEAARTGGSVRYRCGVPAAGELRWGGEIVVRQCPRLCTDDRRSELRRQEEAWGRPWIRSGDFTTWAQTDRIDGQPRYGLVYLSYWRSVPEDAIDRQLVLRMTAPLDRADELRKVASSVRDATFTI
jgi:hypothetical protein